MTRINEDKLPRPGEKQLPLSTCPAGKWMPLSFPCTALRRQDRTRGMKRGRGGPIKRSFTISPLRFENVPVPRHIHREGLLLGRCPTEVYLTDKLRDSLVKQPKWNCPLHSRWCLHFSLPWTSSCPAVELQHQALAIETGFVNIRKKSVFSSSVLNIPRTTPTLTWPLKEPIPAVFPP